MLELLAPAGNMERLETALYFGADAVYLAYKKFGLCAFADNFDRDELAEAVKKVHDAGKKIYVTANIFAHDVDFTDMADFCVILRLCVRRQHSQRPWRCFSHEKICSFGTAAFKHSGQSDK